MSEEVWKDIIELEGYYQVSNIGRVRRNRRGPHTRIGYILRNHSDKDGYHRVVLYRNGKQYNRQVHRLVLEAFIGPCPSNYQCNHKNGKKADNRPENLEYVTPSQNTKHGFEVLGRIPLCGSQVGNSKLRADDVREIRALWKKGIKQVIIAKRFQVSKALICLIVNYKVWAHLGGSHD